VIALPRLLLPTLSAALQPWRLPWSQIVQRLDETLSKSAVVTFAAVAMVGAAMCDQAAAQAMRLLGEMSFIGPEYIVLGFEEYGPLIVAVTFAARLGAGFATEVATLQSDDTLDALLLYGAEPHRHRLAPMAVACTLGCACLGLLSAAVWEAAGMLTIFVRHGVNPLSFFRPDVLSLSSLVLCVGKTFVFGGLVFVCALTFGLRARAGATEVGRATTRAVVAALVSCLLWSVLVDTIWFAVRGPS